WIPSTIEEACMARILCLTLVGLATVVLFVGCGGRPGLPSPQVGSKVTSPPAGKAADHTHSPGGHGGLVVDIGQGAYHAEMVPGKEGVVKIYMLGSDATRVVEVPAQTLDAYARADDASEGISVPLEAAPQPGDSPGKTSMFQGKLPEELRGKPVT